MPIRKEPSYALGCGIAFWLGVAFFATVMELVFLELPREENERRFAGIFLRDVAVFGSVFILLCVFRAIGRVIENRRETQRMIADSAARQKKLAEFRRMTFDVESLGQLITIADGDGLDIAAAALRLRKLDDGLIRLWQRLAQRQLYFEHISSRGDSPAMVPPLLAEAIQVIESSGTSGIRTLLCLRDELYSPRLYTHTTPEVTREVMTYSSADAASCSWGTIVESPETKETRESDPDGNIRSTLDEALVRLGYDKIYLSVRTVDETEGSQDWSVS